MLVHRTSFAISFVILLSLLTFSTWNGAISYSYFQKVEKLLAFFMILRASILPCFLGEWLLERPPQWHSLLLSSAVT